MRYIGHLAKVYLNSSLPSKESLYLPQYLAIFLQKDVCCPRATKQYFFAPKKHFFTQMEVLFLHQKITFLLWRHCNQNVSHWLTQSVTRSSPFELCWKAEKILAVFVNLKLLWMLRFDNTWKLKERKQRIWRNHK